MYVNTELFSPVIMDGLTKAHPASFEYKEWWEEQKRRCLEGYSVGGVKITGDFYWYLNFWKIRGTDRKTGRKTLISPRFVDMDKEFFDHFQRAKELGKNFLVAKRRQVGFSEKTAALIGKEFTMYKHSQSIITAGEEKYGLMTMRMVLRGLNSLRDTEFYKRRNPDTSDYCMARYKEIIDGQQVWKGYQSEIYNITSKNNPQATIGKSPSFIMFEEAGRFPGLIDAYKYIQPALEANNEKTGIALFVGTGGDMEKGAAEFAEMFWNPDAYDILTFDNEWDEDDSRRCAYFVPGYKFNVIDDNGNSLKEPSLKLIAKKREAARKSKKLNAYLTEITQMPLTPDECFLIVSGNVFNAEKLNDQLRVIKQTPKNDKLLQTGVLDWVRDSKDNITGVEWTPAANGPFNIIEHPELDENGKPYVNLYVAGTDSYDRDLAGSSPSLGSMSVFKRFKDADSTANLFVARLTVRPRTANEFYEMTAKLCWYYGAQNLIEYSNLGIFTWYEYHNMTYFLKERPRVAYSNVKRSVVQNKWGVDPSTKEYWITKLRDYIELNAHKIWDGHMIERLIKYREDKTYNCDITIAAALAVVHNIDNLKVKTRASELEKFEFFSYRSDRGKIGYNWEKV
tara:strand:+ start:4170 stop:6038 length:1869 start_codon:yes stop_codon:yes gene_type:complete